MTCYTSSSWARVIKPSFNEVMHPGFAKHLREIARPVQIAYQILMTLGNGNPIGIEVKMNDRDSWAFVLPEVSDSEFTHRIQYFDQDGFSGHFCYKSLQNAVEALVKEKYRVIDVGALDRCSVTERWALGVKRSEIRTLFNCGKISMEEMFERFNTATV